MRIKAVPVKYLTIIILFWWTQSLWGQPLVPWATGQSQPQHLEIKLVTIGPGDDLTSWWGHNALIVQDTVLNTSRFYNYGLFSFKQKNFLVNFAMGRLWFWVGYSSVAGSLDFYRKQNRDIQIQTLQLAPVKRMEIAAFLVNNVKPENCYYLYDHYYDNCATRIRDIINRATDDQLYQLSTEQSPMTLRQHTRCFTHPYFVMDWLLMFLMNDTIDKQIRQWDAMFLPSELAKIVSGNSYQDSTGRQIPFVSDSFIFNKSINGRSIPDKAPIHYWPVGFFLGLLIAGIILSFAFLSRHGHPLYFKYSTLLTGIIFGFPGLVLFLLSFFTNHTVTYHNENLFLLNPLTFAVIIFAIGYFKDNKKCANWLSFLWYMHALLLCLLLILKLFPSFDQDNLLAIVTIGPVTFTFALSHFFILSESYPRDE
jgi:hypothetical protein